MNKNGPLSDCIDSYLSRWQGVLDLPKEEIEKANYRLEEARWKGQKVFLCGNGGSVSLCQSFRSWPPQKGNGSGNELGQNWATRIAGAGIIESTWRWPRECPKGCNERGNRAYESNDSDCWGGDEIKTTHPANAQSASSP